MTIDFDHILKYKNTNVFVETGSQFGHTIQLALYAGYHKVLSIECSRYHYNICSARFQGDDRVSLFFGDSAVYLYEMIKDIDEPMTFWLDAHYMSNDTNQILAEHPGHGRIPLIDELTHISKHKIKTHTIIIDDLVSLSTLTPDGDAPPHGSEETKTENLITFIKGINKDYQFNIHNIEGLGDFLVCRVI